jgi:hypothetical protein
MPRYPWSWISGSMASRPQSRNRQAVKPGESPLKCFGFSFIPRGQQHSCGSFSKPWKTEREYHSAEKASDLDSHEMGSIWRLLNLCSALPSLVLAITAIACPFHGLAGGICF